MWIVIILTCHDGEGDDAVVVAAAAVGSIYENQVMGKGQQTRAEQRSGASIEGRVLIAYRYTVDTNVQGSGQGGTRAGGVPPSTAGSVRSAECGVRCKYSVHYMYCIDCVQYMRYRLRQGVGAVE